MNNHRNLILFVFLLLGISAYAQQNLQKYYSNVWQAEQYLLEENYQEAAKHYEIALKNKEWAFDKDYYNAKYSYKMANRKDTAFLETKYRSTDEEAMAIVREIKDDDQRVRENDTLYDENLQKDTIAYRKIIREMDIQDSLNIIRFKELMQNVNVFDESVINYDEIITFFNHWFFDSALQDYFLSIALKAVHAGTLHPFSYIYMADIRDWRENAIGTISDYGMNYLTIYKKGIEICDSCVFLAFSYNQNNTEWLEKVNKKRAEIYLENVEKQTIRDFLLWEKSYNKDNNIWATLQFLSPLPEDHFQVFVEQVKERPAINYHLTDEHNFNIK